MVPVPNTQYCPPNTVPNTSNTLISFIPKLAISQIKKFEIPLSPIETQKQVIKQIERERKYIDGAREVAKITERKIKEKISEVWSV